MYGFYTHLCSYSLWLVALMVGALLATALIGFNDRKWYRTIFTVWALVTALPAFYNNTIMVAYGEASTRVHFYQLADSSHLEYLQMVKFRNEVQQKMVLGGIDLEKVRLAELPSDIDWSIKWSNKLLCGPIWFLIYLLACYPVITFFFGLTMLSIGSVEPSGSLKHGSIHSRWILACAGRYSGNIDKSLCGLSWKLGWLSISNMIRLIGALIFATFEWVWALLIFGRLKNVWFVLDSLVDIPNDKIMSSRELSLMGYRFYPINLIVFMWFVYALRLWSHNQLGLVYVVLSGFGSALCFLYNLPDPEVSEISLNAGVETPKDKPEPEESVSPKISFRQRAGYLKLMNFLDSLKQIGCPKIHYRQ